MTVTSGLKCLESFRKSGPVGLLEKMLLESSEWGSMMCLLTWKAKATPAGRLLFQLAVSVRNTDGTGFGLLATPNTMDSLPPKSEEAVNHEMTTARPGRSKLNNLRDQVYHQILPTPTVNGNYNRKGLSKTSGDGLVTAIKRLLPTPTAQDKNNSSFPPSLKTWNRVGSGIDFQTLKEQGAVGRLNPEFVEVLMGYPAGYTQL